METILFWILQLTLIPLLSPFFIGLTRKIKARLQNRQGASPIQPYKDLWKLFHKDEIISNDASWIFLAAPFIIFATTIIIGVSIPLVSTALLNGFTSDFLVIIYLFALGTFFLALSGLDTGGAFGGFGSSREMLVAALTEGGLLLSFLTLAIISKSTDLSVISSTVSMVPFFNFVPVFLASISFGVSLLAENARYPFDNPSTHLELTMIHEAMILEYSGKRLALIEWAAANKYLIFMCLGANLFFPWGISNSLNITSVLISLGILIIKVSLLCLGVAGLESGIAKLRLFKLPNILFTSFVLSIIALGIII